MIFKTKLTIIFCLSVLSFGLLANSAFAQSAETLFLAGGTLSGTVTSAAGGAPVAGATVSLGINTTTTDAAGFYSFVNLPSGVYPLESATFAGYNTLSFSNITISDDTVTTRNFSLTPAADSGCQIDTTQSDFQTGIATNTDLTSSSGDVKLALTSTEATDQFSIPAALSTTNNLSATTWTGQTFRAGATGNLTKLTVGLGLASGTSGTITVEIRNLSGVNPGTTVLATTTAGPVTNVGTAALYTVTFATPAAVTSGQSYSIVLRNSVGSTVFGVRGSTAGGSTLANGQVFTSTNSGTLWTGVAADLYFTTFVTPPIAYHLSGNLVSDTKDSNPAADGTTNWSSISWNASLPGGTSLQFQVAGSNDVNGPFDFVGPDGTATTFFTTSGALLSNFNGLRYLKYKAYLSTSSSAVTPTVSDVTTCFVNPRVWSGAVSSDWNNPANWSSSGIPGANDGAIIPSTGVANAPVDTQSSAVASLYLGTGSIVDMGVNTLTVTTCSPAAVAGGSATGYVRGSLTRCVDNSGIYSFPVGTANGYSPVSLGGIGGSGNFNVVPVEGVVTGTDPNRTLHRYWSLIPDSGVVQANITFNYLDADVPSGANESNFLFIRRSGTSNSFSFFTPSTGDAAANIFTLNGVTSFSDWTLGALSPTAAGVSITGKVTTSDGAAIRNARVALVDNQGNQQTALTNSFGYYHFNGITAGRSYVFSVTAKGYQFTPQVMTVMDNLTDLDFIAR